MNTIDRWMIAALASIAFLVTCAVVDGPDDHQAEWDQSEALKELQASEASTERREAAAQALCREAIGESVVLWTPEGHLVCRSRRVAKAQVQL